MQEGELVKPPWMNANEWKNTLAGAKKSRYDLPLLKRAISRTVPSRVAVCTATLCWTRPVRERGLCTFSFDVRQNRRREDDFQPAVWKLYGGRGKKMNEDRQVSEVDRVLVAPLAVYASWRQKEVRMRKRYLKKEDSHTWNTHFILM